MLLFFFFFFFPVMNETLGFWEHQPDQATSFFGRECGLKNLSLECFLLSWTNVIEGLLVHYNLISNLISVAFFLIYDFCDGFFLYLYCFAASTHYIHVFFFSLFFFFVGVGGDILYYFSAFIVFCNLYTPNTLKIK